MKKIILFFLLACSVSFAQEIPKKESNSKFFSKEQELKFGTVKLLAGTVFELTYEYISSDEFTFGSSILYNFDKQNDFPEDFSLTPFARFYYANNGDDDAEGFFIEGYFKYSAGRYVYNNSDVRDKYNAPSVGLSLGNKWVTDSGFVFETLIGFGRTLGNTSVAPDTSVRGDLFVGYRF